jgi:hypothetical protein
LATESSPAVSGEDGKAEYTVHELQKIIDAGCEAGGYTEADFRSALMRHLSSNYQGALAEQKR